MVYDWSIALKHFLNLPNRENNIVSATKMFLNFFGNIFAPWEVNFVSATMFPEAGKQGNIDRKHNVSATMFSSLPRALKLTSAYF